MKLSNRSKKIKTRARQSCHTRKKRYQDQEKVAQLRSNTKINQKKGHTGTKLGWIFSEITLESPPPKDCQLAVGGSVVVKQRDELKLAEFGLKIE